MCPWVRVKLNPGSGRGRVPLDPGEAGSRVPNGYHQQINKFTSAGEDVEKKEASYTAGGNADWCSYCGKQWILSSGEYHPPLARFRFTQSDTRLSPQSSPETWTKRTKIQRNWSRSSVLNVPFLTQQAPDQKPNELRLSPKEQNMGPGCPPQKEIPEVIEFVADPKALTTILSGEGLKSGHLGHQPRVARRVLVRGSQGGTIRTGQGTSFNPSAHPTFQERKRETGVSRGTVASQASGLHLETPVQPASSLPEGEHEVVTHSDEGGRSALGLA
ncbi:hypothetical protein QTO34_000561 [Cnephaeus nilssonii]|uniref:Uncharacterized protein n=1 Tax=Cnephaeus nilssonii TaxID=3371016 RepID=A0AA40ICI0_CNENI|nr:hypothetical protein QTO34_000561 [Eptesicus nilssonii]